MTKSKSTKRALLLSALSLLMCVSMLIGSTFAWFTDTASTAVNTIQSGTLDVVLEKFDEAKGEWVTAEGETLKWITTDAVDNVFWEPGCTYKLPKLRVRNAGNLALKYEVEITALKGDAKLLEVIEFTGLPTNATLTAGAANEFQIEGHMAEEAGNEYQNLKIDNIAITVYATQLAYESDSYGPDYDEEAVIGTYIELGEGEDLLAALASAEAGKPVTIKLMGNVEWPTEGHHGENDITPASAIVINGNGYTITATGAGVTPIGDTEAPMTLKNVKIVDNSVSYKENAWEFTYLEVGGTKLNCENVTFADEIQFGTNATFTNCTFESNEESVYAVWVEDGNATFINCAFTGYRGIKVHEAYGSEVKTVVVDNCTFKNITKKPGMAIGTLNADTTVSITDSTFINCQAGDQGLYIYETDTDVTTFKFVNVNNTIATGVSNNTELKDAIAAGEDTIVLGGGEYSLPTLANTEGVTIIGAEGATIGGDSASTGFGGNFGKNTTIKNVTFAGTSNGVRYSYAQGGTTVFENCTFAGDTMYGFHIDESEGATFIFNDCTFSGFNAFASDLVKVTFNNCTFLHNGNYGHTNIWSIGEFNGCTFGEGATFGTRGSGVIYVDGVKK
ncbi:MAG: right-handed parallel beta-helix repeat-containing protein [Acutalibacteraceae bacterium]|nr:right-handed parallel beta-helix repeat-containing protein [Acutalibacteraceae bacterium]